MKLPILISFIVILVAVFLGIYISNKHEEERVKRISEENRIAIEKEYLYMDTQEYKTKQAQVDQCLKEKGDEEIKIMQDICLKAGKGKYCTPEGKERKYLENLGESDRKECHDKYGLTYN